MKGKKESGSLCFDGRLVYWLHGSLGMPYCPCLHPFVSYPSHNHPSYPVYCLLLDDNNTNNKS